MFGSHISVSKLGLEEAINQAVNQGMTAVQVFCGSPYSLQRSIDPKTSPVDRSKIKVYSHLPYVLNLAGKAKTNTIAWTTDSATDEYVNGCCSSISNEMKCIGNINGCGCVLHIGSIGANQNKRQGLQSVAKSINKISFHPNTTTSPKLLLETMVGNKGVLGCSFEELKVVYDGLDEHIKPNVGFCIDTCHVFAQGTYDLARVEQVDQMFQDFDRMLPSDSLQLLHLNDSKECFGSHKDRHSVLTQGKIWNSTDEGLVHLLKHVKKRNLSLVLETEESDWGNLKEILNKQKLL
jgi:deoxyribonuclease-4